jgi:hypothetical protein
MRFISVYTAPERTTPPTPEEMDKVGKFIEDGKKRGVLVSAEGCLPTANGARMRLADGKFSLTDGPFADSKEVIGGFSIFEVPDKETAIELARGFLELVGQGHCEVRQLHG